MRAASVAHEDGFGLPPVLRDTDANGIADNAGDTDGYVDGDDPEPLSAAGTLVAYVHADPSAAPPCSRTGPAP